MYTLLHFLKHIIFESRVQLHVSKFPCSKHLLQTIHDRDCGISTSLCRTVSDGQSWPNADFDPTRYSSAAVNIVARLVARVATPLRQT